MTFMDTEPDAWGTPYNPTVEAARREAFDLRVERRQLKKELATAHQLFADIWEFSDRLPDDIRDRIYALRENK